MRLRWDASASKYVHTIGVVPPETLFVATVIEAPVQLVRLTDTDNNVVIVAIMSPMASCDYIDGCFRRKPCPQRKAIALVGRAGYTPEYCVAKPCHSVASFSPKASHPFSPTLCTSLV